VLDDEQVQTLCHCCIYLWLSHALLQYCSKIGTLTLVSNAGQLHIVCVCEGVCVCVLSGDIVSVFSVSHLDLCSYVLVRLSILASFIQVF